MEIKSKSVLCGGFYMEIGPVVLGGTEAVPDPHFNRVSILEQDKLDQSLLGECTREMVDGMPFFIDVPHPISDEIQELLLKNGYQPTGESRSSMLLVGDEAESRRNDNLDIAVVEPDKVDPFLDVFLRGFETPEDLLPLATGLFHDLVHQNYDPDKILLYLGKSGGEPAASLYLYHEGEEAGINMVATEESMRGKGFATAMMRRSMQDAEALSIRKLSLETRYNGNAERLYGRLGFVTIMRHEVFTNVPDLKYGL